MIFPFSAVIYENAAIPVRCISLLGDQPYFPIDSSILSLVHTDQHAMLLSDYDVLQSPLISMQKGPIMRPPPVAPTLWIVPFAIAATICCCCPSGVWQDNLGVTYYLFTDFFHPEGDSLPIMGYADTGDLGCGLWTVDGLSNATGPDRSISLTVINPRPNPNDRCCYFLRFTGHVQGSGCLFIPGTYETNDGKCSQSGQMYLYSLR